MRNGTEAITLVNAAGDAGLVVTLLPPNTQGTHEALLRQLLKANQNRVEGKLDKRSPHGLSATHFDGVVRNAQGASAAVHLLEKIGAKILEVHFLIELEFLQGRKKLKGYPVKSLVTY